MKTGIRFALTYSGLSLSGLFVAGFFDKELSGEIESYMFWFYIFNAVLSLLLFPVTILFVGRTNLNNMYRWGIYFLMVLVSLNLLCYIFEDGKKEIVTLELMKRTVGKGDPLWFKPMVHCIAFLSFVASAAIFRRQLAKNYSSATGRDHPGY